MKRRFLSIEITTYWHGKKSAPAASFPPKVSAPPNTARFVLQTLAVGLVLGALWGIRLIVRRRPLTDSEVTALQKQQEREDRTNRWLTELEQNMSEENNDE